MVRRLHAAALALGLGVLVACGAGPQPAPQGPPAAQGPAAAPAPAVTDISVQDLKQRLDAGTPLLLLDVRTPEEFAGDGHIAGAQLLPLQQLSAQASTLPTDQPIACICRSGNRSKTACDQLAQLGFAGLLNVEGGMSAWAAAGLPVVSQ